MRLTLLSFFVLLSQLVISQDAYNSINANQVKTGIHSNGSLFMNDDKDEAGFWVPFEEGAGDELATIFAGGIWLGGVDPSGNLRVSELTHGGDNGSRYLPGPFNADDINVDFDKVWKVTIAEINALKSDFEDGTIDDTPAQNLLEWPGNSNPFYNGELPQQLLAPFADINQDGIYNPYDGDYPAIDISGKMVTPDEILFSVFHDDPNSDFGGEVNVLLYAFSSEDNVALDQSIFARFTTINRRNTNLMDFRFGLWIDADLGCHLDDYVGCDISRNAHYVYNADNEDGTNGSCEGFIPSYPGVPPVLTIAFLNQTMSSFHTSNNASVGNTTAETWDPQVEPEFYNYLTGFWRDGSPITIGGNGFNPNSADATKYIYPDIPADPLGWSMASQAIPLNDPRTIASTGKDVFAPGEIFTVDAVISFTKDENLDNISTVDKALGNLDGLKNLYDAGIISSNKNISIDHNFNVFPNPNKGVFTIDRPDGFNQYTIIDKLGQVLFSGKLSNENNLRLEIPSGMYYMQLNNIDHSEQLVSKLVIVN